MPRFVSREGPGQRDDRQGAVRRSVAGAVIRWRLRSPEEAGIGAVPARIAERWFGADASGVGPADEETRLRT